MSIANPAFQERGLLKGHRKRDDLWMPVLMFWAMICFVYVYVNIDGVLAGFSDTDMAMRLVQLESLKDGGSWYDLSIPRLAPGEGYVSHWSRIVDAGLLALYAGFSLFLPPGQAELMMRLAWPLLMLLVAMLSVAVIAGRVRPAPDVIFFAAALSALSFPARFSIGDIDHHGIQIALLMAAWAALAHARNRPASAFLGGFLVSMAMAVALEVLPFLLPLFLVVMYWFVHEGERAEPVVKRFLAGVAAGTALFMAMTVPPASWLDPARAACDAFAPNWGVPMIAMSLLGLGLFRVQAIMRDWRLRAVSLLVPVAVGAGLFLAYDPECMKGPFAHLDPRIRPLWLDHVKEMRPIWEASVPVAFKALWIWAFATGMWALVDIVRQVKAGRHGPEAAWLVVALAGSLFMALVLSFQAMRYVPFAQWLALPLMAVLLHKAWQRFGRERAVYRVAAIFIASPLILGMVVTQVAARTGVADSAKTDGGDRTASTCNADVELRKLNRVPAGLMAAPIDMGPYILARTHHSVLAAPYHRLGQSMVDVSRIFASSPEKARKVIEGRGIDYVLYCKGLPAPLTLQGGRPPADALWLRLAGGHLPEWLQPVDLGSETPIRLYRVELKRNRSAEGASGRPERKAGLPALRRSLP